MNATARKKAERAARYFASQAEHFAAAGLQPTAERYRDKAIEAAIRLASFGPTCSDCGRSLSDPESVERGKGPICSHKAAVA